MRIPVFIILVITIMLLGCQKEREVCANCYHDMVYLIVICGKDKYDINMKFDEYCSENGYKPDTCVMRGGR
jgi:hypothetical protein